MSNALSSRSKQKASLRRFTLSASTLPRWQPSALMALHPGHLALLAVEVHVQLHPDTTVNLSGPVVTDRKAADWIGTRGTAAECLLPRSPM